MTFAKLLVQGVLLGCAAALLVVAWLLLSEHRDRQRARLLADLEREENEPRPAALVACRVCGREVRVINGIYEEACDCWGAR